MEISLADRRCSKDRMRWFSDTSPWRISEINRLFIILSGYEAQEIDGELIGISINRDVTV